MNGPGPRTMPGLRQLPILPNGQSATGFKCCEKAWLKLICAGRPVGTTSYDGRTTVLGRWLSGAPRGHPRRPGAPQSPIDLLLIAGVHSLPDAQRPPMQRAADRPTDRPTTEQSAPSAARVPHCVYACVCACVCVVVRLFSLSAFGVGPSRDAASRQPAVGRSAWKCVSRPPCREHR